MRHNPPLALARTETSWCQTCIVLTHAGLSVDKNKSPPWLICAWLTNCIITQTSKSCGKQRCTEACFKRTLTPLSRQRDSHRNSVQEVVSAEMGQRKHSVVPSPPAAPVLGRFPTGPWGCQLPLVIVTCFPASLCKDTKCYSSCSMSAVMQSFWDLMQQSGSSAAGNGSRWYWAQSGERKTPGLGNRWDLGWSGVTRR